ncbi:MAG: hypothetical protein KDD94_14450, partial [Calditrichaeota bacterium]|nr:hypothetical protein [Calditrichota bacterium]
MKILLFFCGIFISFSQEFNDMVFAINESEPIILKLENYKLNRDIAQFVLTGDLAFFKSRNNEYQIGYFKGNATFALKPPGQIEQEQLQRYYQVTEIQTTFSEMFFITLDNTFNEMSTQSKSSISAADMKSEMSTIYAEFKQSTHHSLFLKDFLENNKNGSFASLFSTTRFDELYFDIFMSEDEEIRLSKIKKAGTLLGKDYVWPEIMTQFNKKSDFDSYLDPNSELTEKTLVIDGHQIDAKIADNYEFSAKTVSHFTPQKPQKWIPLSLYYDIEIDSVIDNKQRALNIYRNEDFYGFWIELKEEINEPFDLTFYYHCEALRRYGNYIYLWDATGWYPTFSSREYSTFDIHYQFPNEHFFASVGDLISFKKMD